jgi:hypothetical protein
MHDFAYLSLLVHDDVLFGASRWLELGVVTVTVVFRNKRHILGMGSGALSCGIGLDNVVIFGGGGVGDIVWWVHCGDDESVVMMDCVMRVHAKLKIDGRRESVARRRGRRKRERKRGKVIDDSLLGNSDGERR